MAKGKPILYRIPVKALGGMVLFGLAAIPTLGACIFGVWGGVWGGLASAILAFLGLVVADA